MTRPELFEITPEMTEAGKSALFTEMGLYLDDSATDQRLSRVVYAVFREMFREGFAQAFHEQ
jgi:hypothetical protein